jgi:hypothetical protein
MPERDVGWECARIARASATRFPTLESRFDPNMNHRAPQGSPALPSTISRSRISFERRDDLIQGRDGLRPKDV